MGLFRLDKIITDSGACSRSCAKDFIRRGSVTVDGAVVRDPAEKYDPKEVRIILNGAAIDSEEHIYIAMNKPAGLLSATEDKRKPTVVDLLPDEWKRRGIFPVGRLDKDTTGLLLLTDDGEYAHRVISPKSSVPKIYEAKVDGHPTQTDVTAFQEGIILKDGTKCLPAGLEILADNLVRVKVFEGKYHQVKRMLASRLLPVLELKRIQIGNLPLDENLAPGEYRRMTTEEAKNVWPGL